MTQNSEYSFENIDKSNFICLKFKNNSYYYGEVAYLDSQGNFYLENPNDLTNNAIEETVPVTKDNKDTKNKIIIEKELAPEIKSVRKIRHGNGVQIYGTEEDGNFRKFEGQWDKDKRQGFGKCIYRNDSQYSGYYKNDLREGFGKMIWEDGWEYEGNWKEGRLYGKGCFKTMENEILSGEFKNNNYLYSDNIYISPFITKKEKDSLIKIRMDENMKYDKSKIQKQFQFEKVQDLPYSISLINNSYKNERIPLIITSNNCSINKSEIIPKIFEALRKNYFEFNLRQAFYFRQSNKLKEYMNIVKENLAKAIINDDVLLINIDDFEGSTDDSFDPNLKEFYEANSFPSHIWNSKMMARPEVYEKILNNTKYEKQRPHPDTLFKLVLWSKFKIDQDLDNKKIIEIFERRFSRTINLLIIDLLLFVD